MNGAAPAGITVIDDRIDHLEETAAVTIDAQVINGRAYADDLYGQLAEATARLAGRGVRPGLATVIVGDNYPALAYERRVRKLTARLGCHYSPEFLPADIQEADAVATVGKLAADPRISGILILRPLPPQVSEVALYRALDPLKDIEAVHPVNAGLLALRRPRFVPSTPAAVFYMLDRYLAATGRDPAEVYAGSTIVVVGRSANVGTPATLLGLERNATVLCCDEHTHRAGLLYEYTARADILIVAAGVPGLVSGENVKDGVIAIDVGINAVEDPADGTVRLVGDLDFASIATRAEAVSPVPGGVGPITDVWLLANTLWAASLTTDGPAIRSRDERRNGFGEHGALPSRLRYEPDVWMAAV